MYGKGERDKSLSTHVNSYTFTATKSTNTLDSSEQMQSRDVIESLQQKQSQDDINSDTISLTLPDSYPFDNNGRTIDLYAYGHNNPNKIRIDTYYSDIGTKYYINNKSDITIYRDTEITCKTFTPTRDHYCYVGDLLVPQIPSMSTQTTTALQL